MTAGQTTSNGRRRYPRVLRALALNCYVDGQRFDARTHDFSAGGALLLTRDEIPLCKTVLITLGRTPSR